MSSKPVSGQPDSSPPGSSQPAEAAPTAATTQPAPAAATPAQAQLSKRDQLWAQLVSPFGYVLAVSYPVLALSTGARAIYQLVARHDITNYLPVYLTALAALCYLVATLGFAYRRKWTWWLSVGSLGFETFMTLLIGTWSFIDPELIGRTVWRHFGEDYGFFPLFQPLIGLVWLLWPLTMEAYGIRKKPAVVAPAAAVETPAHAE